MHWFLIVRLFYESALSFQTASRKCLGWVPWETFLIDYDQMELVFKEVRARGASMSIIDSEIAALGPIRDIFTASRSRHVKYDRHSVFVIVALDALVSVGRV